MVNELQSIGLWSKKYEKCTVCGTTEKPHQANGLCTSCYYKDYLAKHRPKYNEAAKKWQKKNKEKVNAYKRMWNAKRKMAAL